MDNLFIRRRIKCYEARRYVPTLKRVNAGSVSACLRADFHLHLKHIDREQKTDLGKLWPLITGHKESQKESITVPHHIIQM